MFRAIFQILAAIVQPLSKLWMRKMDRDDDPKNMVEKEKNENSKAIADGTAGPRLDSLINRLHKPPKTD